jgi:hypothetical protein
VATQKTSTFVFTSGSSTQIASSVSTQLDFLPRSQGESAAAGQMGFLRHSEIYRDESLVTHEAAMHVHVGPTTRRGEFPPAIPRRVSSPAEPVSASPADLIVSRRTKPSQYPRGPDRSRPSAKSATCAAGTGAAGCAPSDVDLTRPERNADQTASVAAAARKPGQAAGPRRRAGHGRASGRVGAAQHTWPDTSDRAGWRHAPSDRPYCAIEHAQHSA